MSETKPPAAMGPVDAPVRHQAEALAARSVERRRRLENLLGGRKQSPLKFSEHGNTPMQEQTLP